MRRYKIQDVIRRRQIMLVQVVKEERGNKGAALTTYLSLAGRYGVLMPNTARGGGISRKIVSATDRRRLKNIIQSLDVPHGMGLIVRTAGAKRTKQEINRDYDYLLRLWENIRGTTLKSIAPSLIYEEEDLVKRAIRDMYDKDLEGIVVEGETGYREARQFMRMIMPGQSAKITPYREKTPLFTAFKIEDQLAQIHSPTVPLKSGGYLVINQTEALVAVDVNSGRATRERNIEATALRTNLEAAEEAARQLRLRDLAGLIVIDFIDMDEPKNNRAVEKVLKDCLSGDRARVQMGKISPFGLMEISRQRRRTGVLEGATHVCEHCQGMGRVRNVESSALAALRAVELEAVRGGAGAVTVRMPTVVALYVLNEKRNYLARLEQVHLLEVTVVTDEHLAREDVEIERTATHDGDEEGAAARFAARRLLSPLPSPLADEEEDLTGFVEDEEEEADEEDDVQTIVDDREDAEDADIDPAAEATESREDDRGPGGRRRRRRRSGRREEAETSDFVATGEPEEAESDSEPAAANDELDADDDRRPRRRRGRRGGRRMREDGGSPDPYAWVHAHPRRTPHPSEDPYAWRDPHAANASPDDRAYAREAEQVLETAPKPQPTRPQPGPQVEAESDPYVWGEPGAESSGEAREPRGRSRRHRGGRGRGRDRRPRDEAAAAPHDDVADTVSEDHLMEDATSQDNRPTSEPAAIDDVWADAPPSTAAPQIDADDEPAHAPDVTLEAATDGAPAAAAETTGEVASELEAESAKEPVQILAADPVAEPEPDPAEISGQAAAPRRGWWRRK